MKEKKDNIIEFETILASSVHDMKNSLAMLLGSLEDISNQCSPDTCPVNKNLLRIHHEGQRVNNDIIKLLSLYRIDRSGYVINLSEVCVNDFLEDIAMEYTRLLDGHNIKLKIDCDVDLYSIFDADLVSGVIKTIISNAYQYTKDILLISGKIENKFLVLSVIDNGNGYPDNMLNNFGSDCNINFNTGSTGLGLYFSKRVAELHKRKDQIGMIKLSNKGIQNGGCFEIHLP